MYRARVSRSTQVLNDLQKSSRVSPLENHLSCHRSLGLPDPVNSSQSTLTTQIRQVSMLLVLTLASSHHEVKFLR